MHQHPAFVHCLRQLVPDETVLLSFIHLESRHRAPPYVYLGYDRESDEVTTHSRSPGAAPARPVPPPILAHPQMIGAYLSHLRSLGLVELSRAPEDTHRYRISLFGRAFLDACGVRPLDPAAAIE